MPSRYFIERKCPAIFGLINLCGSLTFASALIDKPRTLVALVVDEERK